MTKLRGRSALATGVALCLAVALIVVGSESRTASAAPPIGSVFFNDATDTIQISGDTTLGDTATFEAVFYLPSGAAQGYVWNEWAASGEDKVLTVGPEYVKGGALNVGEAEASPTVSLDTPHHVAYVVDDGPANRIYLDGVELSSTNADSFIINGVGAHALGKNVVRGDATPSFIGYLNSFRVSSIARYDEDFSPPLANLGNDADTELLYNFSASEIHTGGTTTVDDVSGNGHVGTFGGGGGTSPDIGPTATPSPSPTLPVTVSPTPTPTVFLTPTPTLSPSPTPLCLATNIGTTTPECARTVSPSPSPICALTNPPTVTPHCFKTATPTPTPTFFCLGDGAHPQGQTVDPCATPTATPCMGTPLPTPTTTPTPTPTAPPTNDFFVVGQTSSPIEPTPTPTPTGVGPTPSPTDFGPTPTPTGFLTASPTRPPCATPAPTPCRTTTPSPTGVTTPTPTVHDVGVAGDSGTVTPPPCATTVPTSTPQVISVSWGDTNCDGVVNAQDIIFLLLLRVLGKPKPVAQCPSAGSDVKAADADAKWGDYDCSGEVDERDALERLKREAGLPKATPAPGCHDDEEVVEVRF